MFENNKQHFSSHTGYLFMFENDFDKRDLYDFRHSATTLNANNSSRMTVKSAQFFITFKSWLSIRVFLQVCLATSVHDDIATQCKVVAKYKICSFKWLPRCHSIRQVQSVRPTMQFALQDSFSSPLLCTIFFSVTLPCVNLILLFPYPPSGF